jgi:hypothetical protein
MPHTDLLSIATRVATSPVRLALGELMHDTEVLGGELARTRSSGAAFFNASVGLRSGDRFVDRLSRSFYGWLSWMIVLLIVCGGRFMGGCL